MDGMTGAKFKMNESRLVSEVTAMQLKFEANLKSEAERLEQGYKV